MADAPTHEDWCHYGNACCGCNCGVDDRGPEGDPSCWEPYGDDD